MKKIFNSIVSISLLFLCLEASADVITFENIPSNPSNFAVRVASIGPILFSSTSGTGGGGGGIAVADISALYNHINLSGNGPMGGLLDQTLTLTAVGGATFSFQSAYFGLTNPFDTSPKGFAAIGSLNGVEVYNQDFSMAGLFNFNWGPVDTVYLGQFNNPGYSTIDDITYTMTAAVPEPGTYAMLMAGLGLMGFMVRRRKNEQA